MGLKHPSMPPNMEDQLASMDYEDLLHEFIEDHSPSDLKMVYMQLCCQLGIKPLTSFFNKPKKGREGLENMIVKNRVQIGEIWNE